LAANNLANNTNVPHHSFCCRKFGRRGRLVYTPHTTQKFTFHFLAPPRRNSDEINESYTVNNPGLKMEANPAKTEPKNPQNVGL